MIIIIIIVIIIFIIIIILTFMILCLAGRTPISQNVLWKHLSKLSKDILNMKRYLEHPSTEGRAYSNTDFPEFFS
jgi:predicted Holliday junction resolvase-like endonuclease